MKKRNIISGIVAGAMFLLTFSLPAISANKTDMRVISANQFLQHSAPVAFLKSNSIQTSAFQQNFKISVSQVQAVFANTGVLTVTDFPIGSQATGTLDLVPAHSPIDAKTQIFFHTKDGDRPYPLPSIQSYKGFIRDESNSRVFLNIVNGDIIGSIERGDGSRYVFSPSSASETDLREHVLMSSGAINDIEGNPMFNCLTDGIPSENGVYEVEQKHSSDEQLLADKGLLQFELAVETDGQFYIAMDRNPGKITAYLSALYTMVSSIYEDEVNVTFHISSLRIWTDDTGSDPDPYLSTGIESMVEDFAAYWKQNRTTVSRTIAQLVTSLDPSQGSQVAGIARGIGGLCKPNSGGYSVVGLYAKAGSTALYPTLNYTWDVNVIAHELGHNFGAPHTHSCYWNPPLDSCTSGNPDYTPNSDACNNGPAIPRPGTIMSYCHLVNAGHDVQLTFTPRVATVLRQNAEKATCMKAPSLPVIILQNPLGNQVIKAKGTIDIRWVYSQVVNATLQYSIDKGAHWKPITENIDATQRKYTWTVPLEATAQALVRIFDVSNPLVGDTSITTFQISAPALSIQYPVGGEKIARTDAMTIRWGATLVPQVNIWFSPNNGQSWEEVKENYAGIAYSWNPPAVVTSEALIRVEDASDNTLVSQSQSFTIGVPIVDIISPNGGESWLTNTTRKIQWSSAFIKSVRLEYSLDNGKSWKRIGPFSIDAASGEYEWTTPDLISQQALVRITPIGVTGLSPAMSANNFALVKNPTSVSDYQNTSLNGIVLSPSPVEGTAELSYKTPAFIKQMHISIRDLTGKTILDMPVIQNIPEGDYKMNMDFSSLAQGVYLLVLDADNLPVVRTVTVLH